MSFMSSLLFLQENTVVQTCVVACYSLASAGGFGCYLLSMDQQTYENLGPIAGNRPQVPRPSLFMYAFISSIAVSCDECQARLHRFESHCWQQAFGYLPSMTALIEYIRLHLWLIRCLGLNKPQAEFPGTPE